MLIKNFHLNVIRFLFLCIFNLLLVSSCRNETPRADRFHILEQSILIRSPNGIGVLPAGTRLYFDQTTLKGSDLFHSFINVEGAELELIPLEKPGLIDPLNIEAITPGRSEQYSRALDLAELRSILDGLGVKKIDLEQLLTEY